MLWNWYFTTDRDRTLLPRFSSPGLHRHFQGIKVRMIRQNPYCHHAGSGRSLTLAGDRAMDEHAAHENIASPDFRG
jgi:hypothetical protein